MQETVKLLKTETYREIIRKKCVMKKRARVNA